MWRARERQKKHGTASVATRPSNARLRECPEDEDYEPLALLSGDEAQFEVILDVPKALGELVSTLY